jgi:hypothetical protein
MRQSILPSEKSERNCASGMSFRCRATKRVMAGLALAVNKQHAQFSTVTEMRKRRFGIYRNMDLSIVDACHRIG